MQDYKWKMVRGDIRLISQEPVLGRKESGNPAGRELELPREEIDSGGLQQGSGWDGEERVSWCSQPWLRRAYLLDMKNSQGLGPSPRHSDLIGLG